MLPRWYSPHRLLALFSIIMFVCWFDIGTMASNGVSGTDSGADGLRSTFDLNDFQLGLLPALYSLGLLLASFAFSELADVCSAFRLIGAGMAVWVVGVVLTGASVDYAMLLVARIIVGAGEASIMTLSCPFIDDVAPPERKSLWFATLSCSPVLGVACGYMAGGAIAEALGWRAVFFMEAALGVPLVLFCLLAPAIDLLSSGRQQQQHGAGSSILGIGSSSGGAGATGGIFGAGAALTSFEDAVMHRAAVGSYASLATVNSSAAMDIALLRLEAGRGSSGGGGADGDGGSSRRGSGEGQAGDVAAGGVPGSRLRREAQRRAPVSDDAFWSVLDSEDSMTSQSHQPPHDAPPHDAAPAELEKLHSRFAGSQGLDEQQQQQQQGEVELEQRPDDGGGSMLEQIRRAKEGQQQQQQQPPQAQGGRDGLDAAGHQQPHRAAARPPHRLQQLTPLQLQQQRCFRLEDDDVDNDDDGERPSQPLTPPPHQTSTQQQSQQQQQPPEAQGGVHLQQSQQQQQQHVKQQQQQRLSPAGGTYGGGGLKARLRMCWSGVTVMWRHPAVMLNNVGFAPIQWVLGFFTFFAPKVGVELFHQTQSTSDLVFGAITIVTGIVGTLLGGLLFDLVGSSLLNGFRIQCAFVAVALLATELAFCVARSFAAFCAVISVALLALFAVSGPSYALSMWTVPAAARPLSQASLIMLMHVLGDVPSPPVAGVLHDRTGDWRLVGAALCSYLAVAVVLYGAGMWVAPAAPDYRPEDERPGAGT